MGNSESQNNFDCSDPTPCQDQCKEKHLDSGVWECKLAEKWCECRSGHQGRSGTGGFRTKIPEDINKHIPKDIEKELPDKEEIKKGVNDALKTEGKQAANEFFDYIWLEYGTYFISGLVAIILIIVGCTAVCCYLLARRPKVVMPVCPPCPSVTTVQPSESYQPHVGASDASKKDIA